MAPQSRSRTRYIARAGTIAAVYAALTLLAISTFGVFSWGVVQFRVSEAVTVLALFTSAAVPGLTLGSVVANAFILTQVGPLGLYDVVFGSLATMLGALWTRRFRKRPSVALLGPVVANALIVPAYLPLLLEAVDFTVPGLPFGPPSGYLGLYLFGVVSVGVGQAVVVYGLGWPLAAALKRLGVAVLLGEEDGE